MNLGFGLSRAIPDAVSCAWGARLIYPDDLVFNRQDLVGEGEERAELIGWLNDHKALAKALEAARLFDQRWKLSRDGAQKVVLYEDAGGVIVACPQNSHGYLYVAGWLHHDLPELQAPPEYERVVIEPDPWSKPERRKAKHR